MALDLLMSYRDMISLAMFAFHDFPHIRENRLPKKDARRQNPLKQLKI